MSAGFCGVDPLSLGSLLRAGIAANAVHCLCADKTVTGNGFPDALAENVRKGIVPQLCAPRIQLHFPDPESIRVALPTMVFSESMTLDLGNCTCELRHVTSAHARDTVIVWVKEEQMVFLGDAVYQELVGNVWVERPEKLRKLIQELEPLDFQLAQPAHQKAMTKTDLLAWFRRRLERTVQS